ncbi:hypothetical protein BIW11_13380 [Tropilaelaps mercedesae]|uniref:Uncharacterized protein n=1 Tax=Tropilaelaps mercedesae TaxID=418985 RepID=A0A1V9X2E2_9ACAR|nr:hypothetical protein BIW11_13380 [Tropilaelaps mercedesae]
MYAHISGNYVAGVTENGQLFRLRELHQAQWIDSPGLEKSRVEQLCVDTRGNVLISCGELAVYKFSSETLSWEAFACPFPSSGATKVRLAGCSVSNESDVYATFAWLLADNRFIVCNIGYRYLDKNQWHLRDASQSLFSCSSSLTPSPDLSSFLMTSPTSVHLIHNSASLSHFRREFVDETIVNATWCRNSELILILSPGGKLAILAKFMKSLFGFEQTGNEHGVPASWMHVANVEVGEPLELRPLLSAGTDAILVCGQDVVTISVDAAGHTHYLSQLLSAQPLSISVLSELCLHLASVKLLQREHVALLAIVRKSLSRGLAICKSDQLEEISNVLCTLLEWAVQLESMPIVKLMVFGLRRFFKADKYKKYRGMMLDRYRTALRTFEPAGGNVHARLEPAKPARRSSRRRRASSITECFYNGDTTGAINCLLQNPEISSDSKEFLRRLLETKQESRAFEALVIILEAQGTQLFDILPRSPKGRHLLRLFASKVRNPSIALELLFISGFWRDTLKLSEHMGLPLLETLLALSLNETRRAAGGLRDFIVSCLHETGEAASDSLTLCARNNVRVPNLPTLSRISQRSIRVLRAFQPTLAVDTTTDGEVCDAGSISVSSVLRLHPTVSDDLFVDGLDLLLTEFIEESSRISFDCPHAMLLTVDVSAEITGQPSRLQLVCRAIQLLLLSSESSGPLLDSLAVSLHRPDDSTGSRATALLRCFINMLFCFHLRSRLFQTTDDSESVCLAQQLYLNSFAPPHWLPHLAQIFYTPSLTEEVAQREAFSDFYDRFCQDVCSTRTKLRRATVSQAAIRVSSVQAVRASRLVLVDEKVLDAKLGALNAQQIRLRSGAKLDLRVLSTLLKDVHAMSSRAFLCGVLLYLDESQVKKVRFNPIVDVVIDDSDEFESTGDPDGKPQPSPRTKLLKSFSTSDASVQAGDYGREKKLTTKLDRALKSLERISKLQRQVLGARRNSVDDDDDDERNGRDRDLLDLGGHVQGIELKDMPVTGRRRFAPNQVPGEGRFEESMRRIRELTSRSLQRYQVSTRNLRSSLRDRRILRRGSSLSSLRMKVRPTDNGVHTTMVIDRRRKEQQQQPLSGT